MAGMRWKLERAPGDGSQFWGFNLSRTDIASGAKLHFSSEYKNMGISPGEPRMGEWARNGRESPY